MKEPQLSLFKGYPDTVPDTITLQGIINLIQNDPSVHDHTKKYCYYHEQGSLSAATRKKCPCPCFAVAVTFAGGKQQAHIQSWTSLGIVGIDNVRTYSEKKGIAYEAHYRNEYTMRMGYLLNAYGIPCRKPRNGPPGSLPTTTAMRQASSAHATGTTTGHNTRPLTGNSFASSEEEGYANVAEIEKFLASQALFRQNIITRQCEVAFTTTDDLFGKPAYTSLTDRDVNTLWSRMNKEISRVRLNDIYNVLHSEYILQLNPFREFLFNLKPWDGITDYIGELADTVRVKGDQQRFKYYFRKWFVNILPTLFEEHSVNHEILVLIGPQGSYKATWFNHLLQPKL